VIVQFAVQYSNTQFLECRLHKLHSTQSCYWE